MTLYQLRIFEIVAKHLNLTKAAHELHISQPSISKQLKALEEGYDAKFYLRGAQGIKLTDEGLQFLTKVKSILLQIDNLERSAKNKTKFGSLTIAAAESPSVSLVPALVNAFKQTHPGVQLLLRTNDTQVIEQMLVAAVVELAITTRPFVDNQFVSVPFFSADVVAVVSAANPLSKKKKLSMQDLTAIPVITKVGRRFSRQLEQQLGVKFNVVLECESAEAEKAAVKADVGMALLYRDTVDADIRDGYLKTVNIPELKKLEIKWYFVYKKTEPLSLNAKDFIALLRQDRRDRVYRPLRNTLHLLH